MSLRATVSRSNPEALGQPSPRCRVYGVMDDRLYCVYIATNERHTVLYTGVSGDLRKRIWQHTQKLAAGFTKQYNVTKLVYFETCSDPLAAIAREKQIKAGSRARKIALINNTNPAWKDLSAEL